MCQVKIYNISLNFKGNGGMPKKINLTPHQMFGHWHVHPRASKSTMFGNLDTKWLRVTMKKIVQEFQKYETLKSYSSNHKSHSNNV
jgi:hypothetical protein